MRHEDHLKPFECEKQCCSSVSTSILSHRSPQISARIQPQKRIQQSGKRYPERSRLPTVKYGFHFLKKGDVI